MIKHINATTKGKNITKMFLAVSENFPCTESVIVPRNIVVDENGKKKCNVSV